MSSIEVTVAIIAVLWTSLNTTMTACKQLNDRRDMIITGIKDQCKLSLKHRRLIYENDWQSLYRGIIGYSLAFMVIMLLTPFFAQTKDICLVWAIAIIAALVPFFTFVSFSVFFFKEKKIVVDSLGDSEEPKTA